MLHLQVNCNKVRRNPLMRDPNSPHAPKRLANGCWRVLGETLPSCSLITVLMWGFKNCKTPEEKEFFFWEIADHYWNQDPDDMKFAKHRWAKDLIYHCCRERYLAAGGAASSGKSYVLAGWAVINWLCAPDETMVLLTSTDLKGARNRIWGDVLNLIRAIPDAPCKIRDAVGQIVYADGITLNDKAGLKLIAADKAQSRDKVGKMIGIKSRRLILVADELSDISENVQTAYVGNLANTGEVHNQMIGLSNPSSKIDPFGVFCEPRNGWDTVNPEIDTTWRTKLNGLFIRLDAEDSPNFDEDPPADCDVGPFPYLPTREKIADYLDSMGIPEEEGRKTRSFMRFFKAVFFDSDSDDTYFTEADIVRAGATASASLKKPVRIAGIDLSAANGGDKTVFCYGEVGYDEYGQHSIQVLGLESVYADQTNKIDPPSLQIAEKIKNLIKKHKIDIENVALDASGLGNPICDVLQLQLNSNAFLRVQFGGKASDRRIKNDSRVLARDRYKNRASELFFIGKQYLLGRQIYGVPPVIIKQLTNRGYEMTKGLSGMMLSVEPKGKFRSRFGSSPDEQDAFLVLIEMARTRHGFTPSDPVPERKANTIARWLDPKVSIRRKFDPSALGHQAHLTGA